MRLVCIATALLFAIGVSAPAHAHEIRPALLDITEKSHAQQRFLDRPPGRSVPCHLH